MSRPETDLAAALAANTPIPRDAEGPIFAEPWQAQAFALVVEGVRLDEVETQSVIFEPAQFDLVQAFHHFLEVIKPALQCLVDPVFTCLRFHPLCLGLRVAHATD